MQICDVLSTVLFSLSPIEFTPGPGNTISYCAADEHTKNSLEMLHGLETISKELHDTDKYMNHHKGLHGERVDVTAFENPMHSLQSNPMHLTAHHISPTVDSGMSKKEEKKFKAKTRKQKKKAAKKAAKERREQHIAEAKRLNSTRARYRATPSASNLYHAKFLVMGII